MRNPNSTLGPLRIARVAVERTIGGLSFVAAKRAARARSWFIQPDLIVERTRARISGELDDRRGSSRLPSCANLSPHCRINTFRSRREPAVINANTWCEMDSSVAAHLTSASEDASATPPSSSVTRGRERLEREIPYLGHIGMRRFLGLGGTKWQSGHESS